MNKEQQPNRLFLQVVLFFTLAVIVIGLMTYVSQRASSNSTVQAQTESLASDIADETILAIREYPAYPWLIDYWYAHADELDIEYDAEYGPGTKTEEKYAELTGRCPDLHLRYADARTLEALDPADQKLCAEIIYSWICYRIDQIKRAYHVDFLFCVVTDEACTTQFFLFSGADAGAVRGTDYEQVYTLGTTVEVSESQMEAMLAAKKDSSSLADAGNYADYYAYMEKVGEHDIQIGLTYDKTDLLSSVSRNTVQGTVSAVTYLVILALVFMILVYYYVLHPLKTVQENIRLYTETKDSTMVAANLTDVRPNNEIGQLSKDVTALAKEIDDHLHEIESITAEKERVSTELAMATKIQTSMLPNIYPAYPDRREFDICANMDPAREVGGDFYNYFLIDTDHLFFTIADVSGKGVPAALFMMASTIMLANSAYTGRTPSQILTDTNNLLCYKNQEKMFVTVWVAILEISTGKLTMANAGHEYPLLKSTDGKFSQLRQKHGFVLGAMENMRYTDSVLMLKPGDSIFLYTDGVPDAVNTDMDMFGKDRILAALNEDPDAAPHAHLQRVKKAVEIFSVNADQFDDQTMLCIQYKGPAH